MKKALVKKYFSIFLLLVLLLNTAMFTNASENNMKNETSISDSLSGEILETAILKESDIPLYLKDKININNTKHSSRLYTQENNDLNTVIYQNNDGTETMYIFGEPIKYKNESGIIKDKSIALTENSKEYLMQDNSVKVSIPKNYTDGISISSGSINITLTPEFSVGMNKKILQQTIKNDNSVTYKNIYGEGTKLVYTPTLSGIKEDIVLDSRSGQNEFSFILNTGGLTFNINGTGGILTDENGNYAGSVGQLLIFDSAMNYGSGFLKCEEITKNSLYRITISVDKSYLENTDTVYPVTIDPSITVNEYFDTIYGGYSKAIEDTVLYRNSTAVHGYDSTMTLGYAGIYDAARILYSFYGLVSPASTLYQSFTNIQTENITSAYICGINISASSVNLYAYPYTLNWSEGSFKYSDSAFNSMYIDPYDVTYGNETNIRITNIVKEWHRSLKGQSSSINPLYGIVLRNADESSILYSRIFQSTESSANVYLSIEYMSFSSNDNYYIKSTANSKYLNNSPSTGEYSSALSYQWKFYFIDGYQYTIRPAGNTNQCLTVSGSSLILQNVPSALTDNVKWTVDGTGLISINSGGTKYLSINSSGVLSVQTSGTSGYTKTWEILKYGSFAVPASINVYSSESKLVINETANLNHSIIPSNAKNSVRYQSMNTAIATVDNNGIITATGIGTTTIRVYSNYSDVYGTYYIVVEKKAIIIIPGIMSSKLFATSNFSNGVYHISNGTQLWDPSQDMAAPLKIRALDNYNYISINKNLDEYGTQDIYKILYNKLKDDFSNYYDIVFCPYDWRNTNYESSAELKTIVDQYKKVVLIAHSMGGLVASNFLYRYPNDKNKIESLITLGTPFLGSVAALDTIGNGTFPIELSPLKEFYMSLFDPIKAIAYNLKGLYELFPTSKYFTLNNKSYASYEYLDILSRRQYYQYDTYEQTKNYLLNELIMFNNSYYLNAESIHNNLWINNGNDHITSLINSYYIVGYNLSTMVSIHHELKNLPGLIDIFTPSYDNKGDETVLFWSADIGGKYLNRTYYIKNIKHTTQNDNQTGHYGLLDSTDVYGQIKNLIIGNTNIFNSSIISHTRPSL